MRASAFHLALIAGLAGCEAILGIGDPRLGDLDAGRIQDARVEQEGDSGSGEGSCLPGTSACDNCVDDDADGKVDGADIHCSTAADNDESSFGTAIPGDHIDSNPLDCFFDGDSNPGSDGCSVHPCCSLGAPDQGSCPIELETYDPAQCELSQQCFDFCGPVVPPGCDCLGCCTLCDSAGCRDVQIHPLVSLECADDPFAAECLSCVKSPACATECGGQSCVLCPGQTIDDLAADCGGINQCPSGPRCSHNSDCSGGSLCTSGCCVPPFS